MTPATPAKSKKHHVYHVQLTSADEVYGPPEKEILRLSAIGDTVWIVIGHFDEGKIGDKFVEVFTPDSQMAVDAKEFARVVKLMGL